jgi:hypothetical protein
MGNLYGDGRIKFYRVERYDRPVQISIYKSNYQLRKGQLKCISSEFSIGPYSVKLPEFFYRSFFGLF